MKRIIGIVVVLILLGGAGALLLSNQASKPQQPVQTATPTPGKVTVSPATTSSSSAAKEFTVSAKNFSFSPNQIIVKKGDSVKIIFKDDEGFHNLTIDGYNVVSKRISAGQEQELAFVADKKGTFSYYCAVGNHRELGMQGTLTVE